MRFRLSANENFWLIAIVWFVVSGARDSQPSLFGQDWDEATYTVCWANILIKGENP